VALVSHGGGTFATSQQVLVIYKFKIFVYVPKYLDFYEILHYKNLMLDGILINANEQNNFKNQILWLFYAFRKFAI